jgi:hypothetical protein
LFCNELTDSSWYWSTQGNLCVVEELVGKAQLESIAPDMDKACDAEMLQTLDVHEESIGRIKDVISISTK